MKKYGVQAAAPRVIALAVTLILWPLCGGAAADMTSTGTHTGPAGQHHGIVTPAERAAAAARAAGEPGGVPPAGALAAGGFSMVPPDAPGTLVIITDPAGKGASAIAVVHPANGVVTEIKVVNGGTGYTAPTVVISGYGSGAAGLPRIEGGVITRIDVTSGGSRYAPGPGIPR